MIVIWLYDTLFPFQNFRTNSLCKVPCNSNVEMKTYYIYVNEIQAFKKEFILLKLTVVTFYSWCVTYR